MTVYRTNDVAKWGTGKGADLTPTEVDTNFWDMLVRIVALETGGIPANGIANFVVTGSSFVVVLDDATELGPFTLPLATFGWRGDWQPETTYAAFDVFRVYGEFNGIYVVLDSHTSGLTFDPDDATDSGALYSQLFAIPTKEITGFCAGAMPADFIPILYVATGAITIPWPFLGSTGYVGTPPDVDKTFEVWRFSLSSDGDEQIGSFIVGTDGAFEFLMPGDGLVPTTLATGDVLKVIGAPDPGGMSDFTVSLLLA